MSHPWWQTHFEARMQLNAFWGGPHEDDVQAQINTMLMATRLEEGSRILDVGAGSGKHMMHLQIKGFQVSGLEYSQPIIDQCLKRNPGLDLEQGDMRDLNQVENFDAVTLFDTTFGFFNDKENFDVLKRCMTAISAQGWLVIEGMNAGYWKNHALTRDMWTPKRGSYFVLERAFDPASNCLVDRMQHVDPHGRTTDLPEQRVRLYPQQDLKMMLLRCGFSQIDFYASEDFDYPKLLKPLEEDPESPYMLVAAQKVL